MSGTTIRGLLERSSLGDADATALAARADAGRVGRVLRRSRVRLVVAPPARTRWAPGLAIAVATVALVASIVIGIALLGSRAPTIAPVGPAGSQPASAVPSPSPTTPSSADRSKGRGLVAAGFGACSVLGAMGYCPIEPECWDGYSQVYDIPAVSNRVSCSRRHLYQTVIAGDPGGEVRTQSQLKSRPRVRQLCGRNVVSERVAREIPETWRIAVLPPPLQLEDDGLFRCIVFTGEYRTSPLKLGR